MSSVIDAIPAERLAWLDTATLYHGSHEPGGPYCRHCARELLHEVVTGRFADKAPPGMTIFVSILPTLNDASEWRDDAHRTAVIRPYLKRFLALDPAHDTERIYALIDYNYRKILPDLCDVLGLPMGAAKLRALAPIVDLESAEAALALVFALTPLDQIHAHIIVGDLAAPLDQIRRAFVCVCVRDFVRAPEVRAANWEQTVREILDLICGIE